MQTGDLHSAYEAIKADATRLAGDLLDIPRRVVILSHIFEDSGGNHAFSQIAAHGALWAQGYFEVGGSLGRVIANRYFYNRREKAFRLGLLEEFAESFRRVNRLVCIDTYTNYEFTKRHGTRSEASELLPAELLDALNRVHAARASRRQLSPAEKRSVFEQSFHCEQEITVAPGVRQAVAGFDCRIMKFICLCPVVRFAFFPRWRYLMFRDFSSKEERIEKGMRAYDYAASAGWEQVNASLRRYGRMPDEFFESPSVCWEALRDGASKRSLTEPRSHGDT